MKDPEQTFLNFKNALASLERSVASPPTEERDYAGIVKNFEFTYESCWRALQSLLKKESIEAPFPRVIFEESFKRGLVEGNEVWKKIIEDRNLSSHTYSQENAEKLVNRIQTQYLTVFQKTLVKISKGSVKK